VSVGTTEPDEGERRTRPSDDRLPWEGEPRRVDIICWAGIALSGIYALALLPLVPSLLGKNPVLLSALRGSVSSMVTAGAFARVGEASLLAAILAPILVSVIWDPFYWWAGRLWGRRTIELFAGRRESTRRWIVRVERNAPRLGPPAVVFAWLLPIPSALIYAVVGWTGMSLRRFVVLDLIGSLMWIGLMVGLGYAIGQDAVDVAKAISRYALVLTVVLVVGVIVAQAVRAQRAPGR
jgi:membrane-associated protein